MSGHGQPVSFGIDGRDDEESGSRRWLPMAGAVVLMLVLGGTALALIQRMSGTASPQAPRIQQISVVVPPPPPPPPKIEEPEPEQNMEIEEPEPEPLADNAEEPPGEELGLDAEGEAGSDEFGLRGKKGGRSLLGGGDANAWFAGLLQRELQTLLANDEAVRAFGEFSVVVSIRVSEDGYILDSRVLGGHDPELDAALRNVLAGGVRFSREPPQDLPQPVRLRISSRT